mmetsp:Transcript_18539/g.25152  ORF Transcript_18539/g.25152 Transcript_18539/m.25152 type:complete len:355 (-) Transcript_18539:80-1144(-)|eukprot:CAMPEP_0185792998 /NCGR_PEP_ID=MMETSP1174-20130828/159229_1 /TAXON_ID=35687 /ORGANISM="Dictyocha speculum, Strain CCMP1381" /LENGTH=354 /DNA_ID=CAMNT_0028488101 /DNA_START=453 /DNA_END=1517 /DNA_ORIENTATION=+
MPSVSISSVELPRDSLHPVYQSLIRLLSAPNTFPQEAPHKVGLLPAFARLPREAVLLRWLRVRFHPPDHPRLDHPYSVPRIVVLEVQRHQHTLQHVCALAVFRHRFSTARTQNLEGCQRRQRADHSVGMLVRHHFRPPPAHDGTHRVMGVVRVTRLTNLPEQRAHERAPLLAVAQLVYALRMLHRDGAADLWAKSGVCLPQEVAPMRGEREVPPAVTQHLEQAILFLQDMDRHVEWPLPFAFAVTFHAHYGVTVADAFRNPAARALVLEQRGPVGRQRLKHRIRNTFEVEIRWTSTILAREKICDAAPAQRVTSNVQPIMMSRLEEGEGLPGDYARPAPRRVEYALFQLFIKRP